MRSPTCNGCSKCVLEVNGQFAVLDSYYLEAGGPPEQSAGYWHISCLLDSPYGPAWYEARLKNHTVVRGNQIVGDTGQWTVVQHPRTNERLAFSRGGQLLSLQFAAGKARRRVEGGSVYRVEEKEYNLRLEDAEIVQTMQQSLLTAKTFPVLKLFESLGIADRLHHPEALQGGLIHFERSMKRDWGAHFLAARWEYGVFVPSELESFVTRT
jgi:hypothetical protein